MRLENKESLSIRALVIFTFLERTCHIHAYTNYSHACTCLPGLHVSIYIYACACARATAALEGAGRRTRTRTRTQLVDAGRVGREKRSAEREVVAPHRVNAMQWTEKGKGEERAPRVGKFRSRLDILALNHVHRPSGACVASRRAEPGRRCAMRDAPFSSRGCLVAALSSPPHPSPHRDIPRTIAWREIAEIT